MRFNADFSSLMEKIYQTIKYNFLAKSLCMYSVNKYSITKQLGMRFLSYQEHWLHSNECINFSYSATNLYVKDHK